MCMHTWWWLTVIAIVVSILAAAAGHGSRVRALEGAIAADDPSGIQREHQPIAAPALAADLKPALGGIGQR